MDSFFHLPSSDDDTDEELIERIPSKHAALSTIASRDEDDDCDLSPAKQDTLSSESPHGVASFSLSPASDNWKKLLLPDLYCRHEHDRTHCHGRSVSALPDLKYYREDSASSQKSSTTSSDTAQSSEVDQNSAESGYKSIVREQDKESQQARGASRKHKRVSFHNEAHVREFPLIVGDIKTPNHDGSSSDGIPLTLGWDFECCKIPLQQRGGIRQAVKKKSVEEMMLTPKQRWEKLRVAGGYTDRQLWKVQRELTLQDRDTFFNGTLDS